jgi:hypothetical protein
MSLSLRRTLAFAVMLAAAVLVCDRLSEAQPSASPAAEVMAGRFARP